MEISWSFLTLLWTFQTSQHMALSQSSSAEILFDPKAEGRLNDGTITYLPNVVTNRGPMKKIPGTNIFSAVNYRIAKKTPNGSIFTYVDETLSGAHALQVDSDPARAKRYEDRKDWYGTDRWMFLEAPDFPGWYELRNKQFPNGYTAVGHRNVARGFQMIVTEQNDASLTVKGIKRNYALWKPVGVNDKYFQLKNKQFTQGIVTNTTNGPADKLFYVQVDTDPTNAESYDECGYNFGETLFFTNSHPKLTLNAKIEQFVFPELRPEVSNDKQNSSSKMNYDIMIVTGNKSRYKVAQVYFDENSWIQFQDFNRITVNFDSPAFGGFSAHFDPKMPLSVDGTFTETEASETELSMNSEVASDRFVNFPEHSELYEGVPVPINAVMVITGSLPGGTMLSSDYISENMPIYWQNSTGVAANEKAWQIKVKGNLLFNFNNQREVITALSHLAIIE